MSGARIRATRTDVLHAAYRRAMGPAVCGAVSAATGHRVAYGRLAIAWGTNPAADEVPSHRGICVPRALKPFSRLLLLAMIRRGNMG